jgi:hypothetical protein
MNERSAIFYTSLCPGRDRVGLAMNGIVVYVRMDIQEASTLWALDHARPMDDEEVMNTMDVSGAVISYFSGAQSRSPDAVKVGDIVQWTNRKDATDTYIGKLARLENATADKIDICIAVATDPTRKFSIVAFKDELTRL